MESTKEYTNLMISRKEVRLGCRIWGILVIWMLRCSVCLLLMYWISSLFLMIMWSNLMSPMCWGVLEIWHVLMVNLLRITSQQTEKHWSLSKYWRLFRERMRSSEAITIRIPNSFSTISSISFMKILTASEISPMLRIFRATVDPMQ